MGPATPLEQTLATYGDLVRSGKIRSVRLSNFTGWQLQRAILLARFGHRPPIATLQPQYSLVARELEWELLPLCIDEGVGLLAWSPFGGGWLTGKYRREGHPTGATRLGEDPERGVEAWDQRGTERTWRTVDAVRDIAEESGKSMAQVALRWVMDRPAVSATIWAYAALSSSTTTSVPPAGT